ncbi:hypothetical protein [Tenacibaculum sp. MAR_2009_124]|uniref:hypothetical protein n=1 Tax=Tenacibaculum sp. MAR_2009_124 TaxID=1250059 RepID=UPI0015A0522A|nr:hypothetical protein [Tenacibaculum sp. MAR_2009_124]
MKQNLLYILFLFSITIGYSQNQLVKAEIDTISIRIGEQFQYKLTIDETENVIIPKLENLKGLEVVDSLKLDTINNKLIQKYVLTGFDSGAFYIPRQQIFIKNQAHLTDSLLVNVATVAIDTTKVKKFPIKGIKGEPYQFDDYKEYIFWALIVLLIVITTLYFALKRSDKSTSEAFVPKLAPYQEALQNLKLLDEKLLWQNNKVKAHYSELTEIIRNFIERELNIPALEQTTNELVDTLTDFSNINTITTDKETIQKLEKLLSKSDLVKFAKSKPMAHDIEFDRKNAEIIINNIKPAITEENTETSYSKPVVIIEKPEVKQPNMVSKILIIVAIIAIGILISYGISKAKSMSNLTKEPVENVQ